MKVQMSIVGLLLAATTVAYAVQPQPTTSALQKRLNVIEKIKITEQKQVSATAAPVNANVQAALNAAAAAEKAAPRSK